MGTISAAQEGQSRGSTSKTRRKHTAHDLAVALAVEWPTFLDASNASKLPLFVMGWNADFPDPHNFAFPILHSQGSYPTIQRFKNPAFDRLIEHRVYLQQLSAFSAQLRAKQ